MMGRSWNHAGGLLILLLLPLGLFLLVRDSGLRYEGRSAREWVLDLASPLEAQRRPARLVVASMDIATLPLLRQAMRREDSRLRRWLIREWQVDWVTDRQWRIAGVEGVKVLGPQALSLLPDLIHALTNQTMLSARGDIDGAIQSLGQAALPELIAWLQKDALAPGYEFHLHLWIHAMLRQQMPSDDLVDAIVLECHRRLSNREHAAHDSMQSIKTLVDILETIGSRAEPAVPVLIECLRDPRSMVRCACAKTLGHLRAQPLITIPALISALDDSEYTVRAAAAEALGRFGEQAAPGVMRLAGHVGPEESMNSVAVACLVALGKIGPAARPATPAIVSALRSPDSAVRATAASVFSRIDPDAEAVIPALSEALEDEDHAVRIGAARSLGHLGPAAAPALPALTKALENNREMVQIAVVQALGRLGPAARPSIPLLRLAWNNNQSALGPHVREALTRIESSGAPESIGASGP